MKAVILAAGEGLRCRPLTLTRSKVMLPVANKPLLEHIIKALAENGIKEIILVVGYKKERIMDYFGDGIAFGVEICYAFQDAQLGTANAVKQVKNMVKEDFLVINGDNLIDAKTIADILAHRSGDTTLLAVEQEQTAGYGVVISEKGKVKKILEKPKEVVSHLVNAGLYIFSPDIFEEINKTPLSEAGEYAITDTIQHMIDDGKDVRMVKSISTWIDAVHSWDLLKANAALLGKHELIEVAGRIEEGAVVVGEVGIGENSIIRSGSYIVGPVVIGRNSDIGPNTTILPSTAIGDNCRIGSFTELQNSIIMNDVRIGSNSFIACSIIGTHNTIGSHFITEVGKDLNIEMKGILHHADELGTVIGDGNTIGHGVMVKAGRMIATGCSLDSRVTIFRDIPQDSTVI